MCIARKLTLLAMLVVLAALPLVAQSALAQTEPLAHNQSPRLAVRQEIHAATDAVCTPVTPSPPPVPGPTVTNGGCRLHVSGLGITLVNHLSAGGTEVQVSDCNYEFDVRIDPSGEGYFAHQELTGSAPVCTRKPCGQVTPPTSEGRAWSFFLLETEPVPRERAVILFCHEPSAGGAAVHCEVTIPLEEVSNHRFRLSAADVPGHGAAFPRCEMDGFFNVESVPATNGELQTEQNVEIQHT